MTIKYTPPGKNKTTHVLLPLKHQHVYVQTVHITSKCIRTSIKKNHVN